jgi:hypothetical protein
MEHLCGTFSDENRAALADRFTIGTSLQAAHVDVQHLHAIVTIAQFVLFTHIIAASGANQRTPPLWVIDIEPVATNPTLEYLNVKITVINHMTESTFFTYHKNLLIVVYSYLPRIYLSLSPCWLTLRISLQICVLCKQQAIFPGYVVHQFHPR